MIDVKLGRWCKDHKGRAVYLTKCLKFENASKGYKLVVASRAFSVIVKSLGTLVASSSVPSVVMTRTAELLCEL